MLCRFNQLLATHDSYDNRSILETRNETNPKNSEGGGGKFDKMNKAALNLRMAYLVTYHKGTPEPQSNPSTAVVSPNNLKLICPGMMPSDLCTQTLRVLLKRKQLNKVNFTFSSTLSLTFREILDVCF